MSRPVKNVVIVGSDAPAWMAALALRRAFEAAHVNVHVVELAPLIRFSDVYVGLPTVQSTHRLLGFDHDKLLGACAGVYVLGQRFSNWSKSAPPFIHAYDTAGLPFNNVDFLQYWLKARSSGLRAALEDFSLGAVAAKQGRYVLENKDVRSYSRADTGSHFEAVAYAEILKRRAIKAGVTTTEQAQLDSVRRDGDRISGVVLKSGDAVEGDLFVDATGPESLLIRHLPHDQLERWGEYFPCNRVMTSSGPRLPQIPSHSEISAFQAGWLGLFPLQHRTGIVATYDYNLTSDQEMMERLSVLSGLPLEEGATVSAFESGVRPRAWRGNCVAIGEAAAMLEPLDAAPMQMLQICISHLVSFFPVDADRMLEASAYSDSIAAHARNIRDFQLAHYKLNRRMDERLWDRVRETPMPESLAYKLKVFKRRGRVALYDFETFQAENWTSNFIGHGLIPDSYDPLVDLVSEAEHMGRFQQFLGFIANEVRAMPSMEAHLEMHAPFPRATF